MIVANLSGTVDIKGFSQHARSFPTKPGEEPSPVHVALETSISDGSLLEKCRHSVDG